MRKTCMVCQKCISHNTVSGCCIKCYLIQRRDNVVSRWLQTGDTGMGVIRDYIYNQQKGSCAICGLNGEWNYKPLNMVLDHIDGNAGNNNRSNLRLICPNCDSQLETFKSRNKKSARVFRK